jgi:hypothetical protein
MTPRQAAWAGLLVGLLDAGADQFSSARAFSTVQALAADVRPIGSVGHERARHYLTRKLEESGLEVEVQEATMMRMHSGRIEAARVRNLLARKPGRGVGGAVLLLAHYDTRPQTFGAADDAAGLATILETLRALVSGPQAERDILVVITDGEELGLYGARAFVEQSPWAREVEFLINIEARGNRGPSMMFETSPGNLELVQAFAARAPFPFGNSLSYEVYRRMPNDSDFSAFRETSIAGLNFAMIGNHSSYHTLLDSVDRLDRRSLQHHGSNVLALTRYLSNLSRFERSGEDAVYFSLSPNRLVVYPASTARGLAVGLLLMAAAALLRSRGSGLWSAGGIVRGALLALAAAVGGYVIGFVFWKVLQLVAPALLEAPHARPYRTLWFGGAMALLVLGTVIAFVRRLDVNNRPMELLAGALVVWAVAATLLSFSVPGASYLLTWPACTAWIAWWIVARAGAERLAGGLLIVAALGAAPGVFLFAPTLVLFLQALTLSGAAVPAALLGLLLTLFIPQLTAAWVSSGSRVALYLSGVAAIVVLLGAALSWQSSDRPRPDTLFFVASGEGSHWYSLDSRPDAWTVGYLSETPERLPAPNGLALGSRKVLRARTTDIELEAPWIEAVESTTGGERAVIVAVGCANGGQILHLRVTLEGRVETVWIDDSRVEVESTAGEVRMTLVGPSSRAEPWRLRFAVSGPEPLEIDVLEQRFGLPSVDGLAPLRPPEFIPSSNWRTDSTYILHSIRL